MAEDTKNTLFALVDCNNFYVSCERLFRPALNNRPVVVLSNNDGCFISRSDEVKHLNIPMGAPYFKWKREIEAHNAEVFSANFPLYGDLSNRIMSTLASFVPQIEIYSIDEAFLNLNNIYATDITAYMEYIGAKVKQWIGIPVSIGIGPTKSLAKLGNKLAKKRKDMFPGGVCNMEDFDNLDTVLKQLPVEEVWGIGRSYSVFLRSKGIKTVYDLKQVPDEWARKHLTVTGLRIVWELRGLSCLPLEEVRPLKKGIMSSRSFGRPITTLRELKEAVATYTSRAAEKLRADGALASYIGSFILTNRFDRDTYYSNSFTIALPQPSDYTPELVSHAFKALEKIYRPGSLYKKAGIMLTGIIPNTRAQMNLFSDNERHTERNSLMKVVDVINRMYGRHKVRFASEGVTKLWTGKSEQRSPRYTTDWRELVEVKA